jgi:hypothetical protein
VKQITPQKIAVNQVAKVAEKQVKDTIDSLLAKSTEILPKKSKKWMKEATYNLLDKLDLQK